MVRFACRAPLGGHCRFSVLNSILRKCANHWQAVTGQFLFALETPTLGPTASAANLPQQAARGTEP
jgi:hypothetical protein